MPKNWILVKLLNFKKQSDSLKRMEMFELAEISVGLAVIPAASETDPPSIGPGFVKSKYGRKSHLSSFNPFLPLKLRPKKRLCYCGYLFCCLAF